MAKGRRNSKDNNPKGEASKRIEGLGKDIESYPGRCLFPSDSDGGVCTEPPSRCHVIPESSVLNRMKDEKSGKVREFDWNLGKWKDLVLSSDAEHPIDLENSVAFEPREVGTGEACTGLFACQTHDQVFNPSLDTDNPDFGNPAVRRLAIGRAVLYAADLASKRKFLVDKWNSQCKRSADKGLRKQWKKERKLTHETHRKAHSTAERWRNMWRAADCGSELPEDIVDWCALTLRSTLTFAACVFYGQATLAMVVPVDGERHNMTILYFTEDSLKVEEDKERLAQKARNTEESDEYGVSIINELMSGGNGVVAASPASYEELRDEDRETTNRIIMEKLRFWGEFTKS